MGAMDRALAPDERVRPVLDTFVVSFNAVPMAHRVAELGARLRSRIIWTLLGVAVWTAIWWRQREQWGTPWVLVAGYGVSVVLVVATLVRLLGARRALARVGSGPALEAGRHGLRVHALDGSSQDLAWEQVRGLRSRGSKLGVGPRIVVDAEPAVDWELPLSFLDALPGTVDAGLRATSGGRVGLDLGGLDRLR